MRTRALLTGVGLVAVAAFGSPSATAEEVIDSEKARFKVETLAEGLQNPWGLAELPDGRLLVTERAGRLRVISAEGQLQPEPITGTPEVLAKGQGGLLDILLHPDYERNGWIYLSFSDPKDGKSHTKIVRGRLKDNAWVDQETIFEAPAAEYTGAVHHFGNRMQIRDGHLFFTIGDRGDRPTAENNAQKLGNVSGKVHRVRDDGTVPSDNPFVDEPGAAKTIWSYGHRNQQGLRFAPDGTLWAVEHGPRGGDELNVVEPGKNYGWAVVTYGINYNGTPITDKTSAPGLVDPVLQWTPSIAVGGLEVYTGDKFPAWRGNLIATALAHRKLVRMELGADRQVTHQEMLLEKTGRIRDVRQARDGSLFVIYDAPGKVVRLSPAS